MWDRYQPPGEQRPEQPEQPARPAPYRSRPAKRRTSSAVAPGALALGIVGVGVVVAVAAGGSLSSQEATDDGWYACIESYQDEEPGILTPADLCEIGHERPDGYTEYDDYDFDPFQVEEHDSWVEWEREGSGSSSGY